MFGTETRRLERRQPANLCGLVQGGDDLCVCVCVRACVCASMFGVIETPFFVCGFCFICFERERSGHKDRDVDAPKELLCSAGYEPVAGVRHQGIADKSNERHGKVVRIGRPSGDTTRIDGHGCFTDSERRSAVCMLMCLHVHVYAWMCYLVDY